MKTLKKIAASVALVAGLAAAGLGVGSPAAQAAWVVAGSPSTSLAFAESVGYAYLAQPLRGYTVVVDAYSPVTGQIYAMTCTGYNPVVCTGGTNAVVLIYP